MSIELGISSEERRSLETCLGDPFRLDGSFASMWALERVFETLRRAPAFSEQCTWIPHYLSALMARSWTEMGLEVRRGPGTELATAEPDYRVEVDDDCLRLLQPPRAMPSLFGIHFIAAPGLGAMCLPWYGLATVLQNHAWAHGAHESIGKQRDHLDRGVPWLTREQAKCVTDPALREVAEAITRVMVWPPFGYTMNDHGELNRRQMERACSSIPGAQRAAILRDLSRSQDRSISLLASWAMTRFEVMPDDITSARAIARAVRFFRLEDIPRNLARALDALPVPKGFAGLDDPRYVEAFESSRRDPAAARAILDDLVAQHPERAAYVCLHGFVSEGLGDQDTALADYHRAIELRPRYVQALINRAVLFGRLRRFDESDRDLLAVRAIEPEHPDVANNLLSNYFFRLRGDVPLRRLPAPPAPPVHRPAPRPARTAAVSPQVPAQRTQSRIDERPSIVPVPPFTCLIAPHRRVVFRVNEAIAAGQFSTTISLTFLMNGLPGWKPWQLSVLVDDIADPSQVDVDWLVEGFIGPAVERGISHAALRLPRDAFGRLGARAQAAVDALPAEVRVFGAEDELDRWVANLPSEAKGASPVLMQRVREAVAAKSKIVAIRHFREAHGCRLVEAKRVVDCMARGEAW